ncbi:MAG: PEP-CTERM sorting domain-containing protein [Coleofasciculus sp. D1-CHI-01]|uniref:PEP-CTERM sorting domain-containing protein n=1 Tax=Coleofasciculus sp. D1-CHI-01 TaxID=3068482 RepID=UPI0032F6F53D
MNLAKTSTVLGLVAGGTLALSAMPADAASFNNGGILFDTDTKVDFEFLESHGKFQSTLFIVEATDKNTPVYTLFTENEAFDTDSSDFMGTCPTSVTAPDGSCTNWFEFQGGVEYSLLLDSGNNGKVWSTDLLNMPVETLALFKFEQTDAGKYTIDFEDKGIAPYDFNDFSITAQVTDIPEPTTLVGLGLIGGALALTRRRKAQ